MMPHTVPNSPMNGAMLAVVARNDDAASRACSPRCRRHAAAPGRARPGSSVLDAARPRAGRPSTGRWRRRARLAAAPSARHSRPGRCRPAGCPPECGRRPAPPRTCCCGGRCRGSSTVCRRARFELPGLVEDDAPGRRGKNEQNQQDALRERGRAPERATRGHCPRLRQQAGHLWPWSNARTVKAHDNETSNPCKVRRWDSATGQPSTQANGCQTYDTMAVLAQVIL